jgi:hypothetical protein
LAGLVFLLTCTQQNKSYTPWIFAASRAENHGKWVDFMRMNPMAITRLVCEMQITLIGLLGLLLHALHPGQFDRQPIRRK